MTDDVLGVAMVVDKFLVMTAALVWVSGSYAFCHFDEDFVSFSGSFLFHYFLVGY